MNTIDELNRIKIANLIINRSSQRLGIKPVYVGSLIDTKVKAKPADDLKIIAQKLSQEKFEKRKSKRFSLKSFKLRNLQVPFFIFLGVAIVYSLVFVFKPATVQSETQSSTEEESTSIFKSDRSNSVVITSGAFKTLAEAEELRDTLSEKLGVPLEILHDSKYFTVQIGPSYEDHADAMLVFDELSRYSIKNLSLRSAG